MPKRVRGPHHSAPCQHPQSTGLPCPNRAVDHHPEHGPICALHAHHYDTSQGRTATILVRLAPDEHQAVSVVADTLRVSLSDLGRDALLSIPLPDPPRPRIDAEAYAALGKVGGNLNQIARALNLNSIVDDGVVELDTEHLAVQIAELRRLLKEVRLGLAGAS